MRCEGSTILNNVLQIPVNTHIQEDSFITEEKQLNISLVNNSIEQSTRETFTSEESISNDCEAWRHELPSSLRNRTTLYKFNLDGCTVYLLGTSHISKSSCNDVQELMSHVKPQGLFLELCSQRLAILSPPPPTPPLTNINVTTGRNWFGMRRKIKPPKVKLNELIQNVREQHPELSQASATSSALLTKIQSDYASKLNITIGAEFREAYEAARELNIQNRVPVAWNNDHQAINLPLYSPYCRVVLGDRPVRLTLIRCWESLKWWGKIKLVLGLLWSTLFQPSEKEITEWMESILHGGDDVLTKSIDELRGSFPSVARVIIEERDAYMFCKLVQMVEIFRGHCTGEGGNIQKLVAVVGAGHCPGICRWVHMYTNGTLSNPYPTSSQAIPTELLNVGRDMNSVQDLLKHLIDTKSLKHNSSDEMQELLTDVIELHAV